MSEKPWYHNGLQFECSECGDCCTGAPGYVWVNKEEIAALAQLLGLGVEAFMAKYTRQIGIRHSLIELANYDCVFLDGERYWTAHWLLVRLGGRRSIVSSSFRTGSSLTAVPLVDCAH